LTTVRSWALRAVPAGLATAGLAVALALRPAESSRATEAYVLFLGALGAALLTRATSRAFPASATSRVDEARARPRPPEPVVAELQRIERELAMSLQSAFDTHYRLRPLLRELAASPLGQRGLDLDGSGGRAEQFLGSELWQLVRPDVERPSDHHAAGVPIAAVERAVRALEALR
jgi:hypothetical protein